MKNTYETLKTAGMIMFMALLLAACFIPITIAEENINVTIDPIEPYNSPGETMSVEWSLTGGKAPYKLNVRWIGIENDLMKTLDTKGINTRENHGTVSFNLPDNITGILLSVEATDASGNTGFNSWWRGLEESNYKHAVISLRNQQRYVYPGNQASVDVDIDLGNHTAKSISYRWAISDDEYDSSGTHYPVTRYSDVTDLSIQRNKFKGTIDWLSAEGLSMNLELYIETTDGWIMNYGDKSDYILILQPGESPFSCELTITPENGVKNGEKAVVSWRITGVKWTTYVSLSVDYNEIYVGRCDQNGVIEGQTIVPITDFFILADMNINDSWTNLQYHKSVILFSDLVCSVILPSELITIEDEAFANIENNSISIPESVKKIGENAFSPKATLRVPKGSYAEKWVKNNHTGTYVVADKDYVNEVSESYGNR